MARMTLQELSGFINVSPATISRVLNGKGNVADKTRNKVLAALEELCGTSYLLPRLIGVVVPDASNPFFSRLCFALEGELSRRGAHAVIASSEGRPDRELALMSGLQSAGVKGIVFVSSGSSGEVLHNIDVPVLPLDRRVAGHDRDFVTVDSTEGTRRAVDYLIAHGHQRIGYLKGLEGTATAAERFESFKEAMAINRLDLEERWIVKGDYQLTAGRECAEILLALDESERPTAMMCGNDLMAIGLAQRLQQAGWRLPDHLSLIGFDDIEWAEWTHPSLTTIAQPIPQMVREACDLLEDRIKESAEPDQPKAPGREIVVKPKLRVRQSVAAPRGSDSSLRLVHTQ